MQHSIFDRIYLAFLITLIASFGIIIAYTTFASRSALTKEKEDTLTNEAQLIASQTLDSYVEGTFNAEELSTLFTYYAEVLNADIWYVSNSGMIVSSSKSNLRSELPSNIFGIDGAYVINKKHTDTGNFFGVFEDEMISINIPLSVTKYAADGTTIEESSFIGALIMHSPATHINSILKNTFGIVYLPCLVIIIIAFIFIQIISKKVLSPVKQLSAVAQEYSKGNFNVKTEIKSEDEIGQLALSME